MLLCPQCLALRTTAAPCPRDGATPQDYATALVGQRLGPWRLRAKVGEGGMALVYAAEHEELGRLAAIKVLRPELSLRESLVARFLQEARAVSLIGHQNIVTVYDFGRAPGDTSYIVMEYLRGATLRELLERGGVLPLERIVAIVEQVGQALAAAHDKGFVHCDVKPENIVVDDSAARPAVKLLDFGIATLLSADARTAETATAVGTAPYMAPEQLRQGAVDARTDVYALGALTYELLSLQLPFPGPSAKAVRLLQAKRAPAPPCARRGELNVATATALDTAVLRALALAPEQRFAGVLPFLNALEGARTSAGAASSAPFAPAGPARASSPRWRAALAAGVLLALVAGLSAARWWGLGSARRSPTRPLRAPASSPPRAPGPRTPTIATPAPLDLVLAALRAGDAATRAQVLGWLGELNRTVCAAAVREATTDAEPRVRRSAALALAALRPTPPEAQETLQRLLATAQGQPDQAWLRLDAATALAQLGSQLGVLQLERELQTANPWLRIAILEALARAGQRSGLALARQLRETTPATRATRLGALLRLERTSRGRWAKQQLLRALQSGAWEERLLAAQALAPIVPGRSQAALRQALRSGPSEVQLRAAVQLARDFGDARAGPLLRAALQLPAREDDAVAVALALGRLAGPQDREALRAALARPLPLLRLAAAVALLEP
ncbi:MAG: protein kinase [Proteobacteria bacterium]|nr:protein kinase [Pseudomonadota bacterium]